MGKTVKSRTIFSILSFLMVVVICVVANSSVPKLFESYKQKEIAQQASMQTTKVVKKKTTEPTTAPAEEVTEAPEEDANVYDVEEPTTEEEVVEEEAEEDFDFDEDFGIDDSDTDEDNGGFLSAIIDFFGSIFEKLSSCKLLTFFKDILAKILSVFGITL